jgi:hypothetical protein
MDIEDMKMSFVMSVFDSITKQIHQSDLKASFILSWNGVIAILLSHLLASIVHAESHKWTLLLIATCVAASLASSGAFCYKVLRPRVGVIKERNDGLLWSGDIHKLGVTHPERIEQYMCRLLTIDSREKLYEQFVTSIVLISEISLVKNKMFIRALISTVVSFSLLVSLMAIMGLKLSKL